MTQNTKTISPLRQRMTEDMVLRKLSPKTQAAYIRAVKNFTRFIRRSPDTVQDDLAGIAYMAVAVFTFRGLLDYAPIADAAINH